MKLIQFVHGMVSISISPSSALRRPRPTRRATARRRARPASRRPSSRTPRRGPSGRRSRPRRRRCRSPSGRRTRRPRGRTRPPRGTGTGPTCTGSPPGRIGKDTTRHDIFYLTWRAYRQRNPTTAGRLIPALGDVAVVKLSVRSNAPGSGVAVGVAAKVVALKRSQIRYLVLV